MPSLLRTLVVALLLAAALAPAAAAGPGLVVGAAEDSARTGGLAGATTKMSLARLAGLDAIRLTSSWRPGLVRPTDLELTALRAAAGGAQLNGIRVFLAVYTPRSRWTPRNPVRREQFAAYTANLVRGVPGVTDVIVGNEPNLNRFWMPQFDRRGRNAASPAYVRLLARTYDVVKEASPEVVVVGGAVSPRGSDNHRLKRHTHSPTKFILDMGRYYRAIGRDRPIMDAFSIHPYPSPGKSPLRSNPRSTSIGIADYRKLVRLLGRAFNGTAQAGSQLPIVYAEFGIQSKIPKAKRRLYRHLKAPAARHGVSERAQARQYRQAIALAQCQPTVSALLIFHVTDERDARGWQSGLFYADNTPKSSLPEVRIAAELAREGRFATCAGGKPVNPLQRVEFQAEDRRVQLLCDRACRYVASLVRVPREETAYTTEAAAATAIAAHGEAPGGEEQAIELGTTALDPGHYRYLVRVFAATSHGAAVVRYGPTVEVTEAPAPAADPPPAAEPPPDSGSP